jgi:magnesium transporter
MKRSNHRLSVFATNYGDKMKTRQLLNRKKTDPAEFYFTGSPVDHDLQMQLFIYNSDECTEQKPLQISEISSFDDTSHVHWLNVYGLHKPNEVAELCRMQDIHSLVIQDLLDVNQRPKYQEFDTFCFLTIKSIIPESPDMSTEQISFVFGKNYLISFQEKETDYFDHLRFRLREKKGILREMGPDYLLFTMLEAILDNYFKTLVRLEEEIDRLGYLNITADPSPLMLEIIERNKKYVHNIRKVVLPIREFAQSLERADNKFVELRSLKYFYEIKDLCLTLIDQCDSLASSLESSTNLFFSIQGHKMNQVMKTLTVVAAIFIPLTFIAGIYGMNFDNMPELGWKFGYLGIWLIFIIVFGSMVIYFRKKKWF